MSTAALPDMPRSHPIRFRRGTSAEWNAANPVLAEGEPGYETDTGVLRVGDGTTEYASLAASSAGAEIVHDWNVDGWTPFTNLLVSPHGAATATESVDVAGRGRVTGHSGTADGNRRDWWLRDGTLWENSEIESVWWGGSSFVDVNPQLGHVHRAVEVSPGLWRAYVVTNNIFGGGERGQTINSNIWETDTTALTLGSNGGAKGYGPVVGRTLNIISVERTFVSGFGIYLSHYYVSNAERLIGMENGDLIDIVCSDATFDQTDLAINAIAPAIGYVEAVDPTASAVPLTAATGTITPEDHRLYWPYHVKSQLRGTVLRVKVWGLGSPEPDWGDTRFVGSFDTAGANDPAPDVDAAPTGPGLCGLASAHLRNDAYLEFGDTVFRQL